MVQRSEIEKILARVSGITTLEEAVDTHFVIETIDENLVLKQKIFSEIEDLCSCETVKCR